MDPRGAQEIAEEYGAPRVPLLHAQASLIQCLQWAQHAVAMGQTVPTELQERLRRAAHQVFRTYGAEPPSRSGTPARQTGLEEPEEPKDSEEEEDSDPRSENKGTGAEGPLSWERRIPKREHAGAAAVARGEPRPY